MSVFFHRGKIWLHILVQLLRNSHIGGQLVIIARFHKKISSGNYLIVTKLKNNRTLMLCFIFAIHILFGKQE